MSLSPVESIFRIMWRRTCALGVALFLVTAACSRIDSPAVPGNLTASGSGSESRRAVKVFTTQEGIYRVTLRDLVAAGLPVEDLASADLRLYQRGLPVNYWVRGEGQASEISFYSAPVDNRYSNANISWFVLGEAIFWGPDEPGDENMRFTAGDESPEINLAPGDILDIVTFEENLVYMPQAEGTDHWFGAMLPAPQQVDMKMSLADPGAGEAVIRLAIWSKTEGPGDIDHHMRLAINGENVADESWDGKGSKEIVARFDSGILLDGENELTLEAVGDTGLAADIAYLNRVSLTYPRRPIAHDDRLVIQGASQPLLLDGFSGPPAIFEISTRGNPVRIVDALPAGETFTPDAGKRYFAVGPQGALPVERIEGAQLAPDLRDLAREAEYLVVAPEDLLPPLQPLIDLRQGEGLQTFAVQLQTIYDQFSYGYPEPEAIQRLVQTAQEWAGAPRFLLLVGDASYDPRGYIADSAQNRLPTFLVDTVYGGETASDVGFGQINPDPWPDIAIGRIPAQTPAQVETLVTKILAYERSLADWENGPGVLAVADGQDATFKRDAQGFLDLFSTLTPSTLIAPPAGAEDTSERIKEKLNEDDSTLLVSYFGHGSVNMWGKDRLFTVDDVQDLHNKRLPIVINLTCLTGLFTHPKVDSLAETLLWQPQGGAVAVLAPSSLTLPSDQTFLYRPFVKALLEQPTARLGEIHLAARRQVPLESASSRDVMRTFMLFGDPALRLPTLGE